MPKFMLGNVRHQLDDKYRMRIPAKFRDGIGAPSYMIPGRSGCLYVLPESKFESVIDSIGSDTLYGNDALSDVATEILGNGDVLEYDPQGRSKISQIMRETAKINKDIVFVGKGTYLEIWPAEIWDERFSANNQENLSRMLDNLKKFGV